MKIKIILTILIIISTVSLIGCSTTTDTSPQENNEQVDYSCQIDSDCVHTCGAGCANKEWAKTYNDPCVNKRAFDCTCDNDQCYSDGKPPSMYV